MSKKTIRKRVYEILEKDHTKCDRLSTIVDYFLQILIILNVIAVLVASVKGLQKELVDELYLFEFISVNIFCLEYCLRVWCCIEGGDDKRPFMGRVRYIFRFLSLIDLIAILPFFLIFMSPDLRMLRMVRLLKIFRYSKGITLFARVFYHKRDELISTFFIFIVFLVIISSLGYMAEKDAQPEVFGSIPEAMWWGIATLTTVGYGDLVPVTVLGKLLGGVGAVLGIAMYALPSAIIVSGFVSAWEEERKTEKPKK